MSIVKNILSFFGYGTSCPDEEKYNSDFIVVDSVNDINIEPEKTNQNPILCSATKDGTIKLEKQHDSEHRIINNVDRVGNVLYIYVLLLELGKYYVGKTTNPSFRIDRHFDSNGSEWTRKYKPIKILEIMSNCDDFDEDKYTLKYMAKKGIYNVRGGSFCKINFDKETIAIISKMIMSSEDKCYMCGEKGHFANKCTVVNSVGCKYCYRKFKTKRGATYHENFYCKLKKKYI
jgi:predicted GIY-YIG superfamily endonuclease